MVLGSTSEDSDLGIVTDRFPVSSKLSFPIQNSSSSIKPDIFSGSTVKTMLPNEENSLQLEAEKINPMLKTENLNTLNTSQSTDSLPTMTTTKDVVEIEVVNPAGKIQGFIPDSDRVIGGSPKITSGSTKILRKIKVKRPVGTAGPHHEEKTVTSQDFADTYTDDIKSGKPGISTRGGLGFNFTDLFFDYMKLD
jgi:hypothetical protein